MKPLMTTYSGLVIDLSNLQKSDILLTDVAHSLALVNRFNGHTDFPIPVAQHSTWVSRLMEKHSHIAAWIGLHHDDSEYLLGDITKWFKQSVEMKGYRTIEKRVQNLCYQAMGVYRLAPFIEEELRKADDLMVRFEAEVGFKGKFRFDDTTKYPPITPAERERLAGWRRVDWCEAEAMFLAQAQRLAQWAAADPTSAGSVPAATWR